MNIRDAKNLPLVELNEIYFGNGYITEIQYKKGNFNPYTVWNSLGFYASCKGHDQTEDLQRKWEALKPPGTTDRMRQYGPMGSTIN